MRDIQFYFLSEQYYIDFPDENLMRNKEYIQGIERKRPCFFAFADSKQPQIYWLVPITSKVEKYKKEEQRKIQKYGVCNTIRFGQVLGREAAFLIQNMCPVIEKYMIAYIDKNQMPIRIDQRIEKDVIKYAKKALGIYRRGSNVIFPDIQKIYTELEIELHSENSKE